MVIPTGMDVLDFTPLQFPADDRTAGAITTHFDYNSISGHLVKVDILGHDDPTVIKMLHELTGIDPLKVPMDDPDTLALFSGANPDDAIGIPEFGTRFVRNMLTETKPSSFGDLVRISGLSHGTDVWANNARDLIKNGTAKFREVIATREDIFLYLMKIGMDSAVAFGIAEKVRKGRPLSEEDIGAMRQASVPEWYVDSCKKISYLFPKAHAAAYVTNAFRIAYFKVHHPQAFAAAYFTFHGSSMTVEHMHNGRISGGNRWTRSALLERHRQGTGHRRRVGGGPRHVPARRQVWETLAVQVAFTQICPRGRSPLAAVCVGAGDRQPGCHGHCKRQGGGHVHIC